MCEFCENGQKRKQVNGDMTKIVYYEELKLHTLIAENKDGVRTSMDIEYCPICGRKLT